MAAFINYNKKFTNNDRSPLPVTEERLKKYIASVRWQEAKSYAKTYPHEYTIRDWDMDKEVDFVDIVYYIRENGYQQKFKTMKITYYEFEGFKYWTMGDPLKTTWVLNRAML